jgi:CBS domain-containing protein
MSTDGRGIEVADVMTRSVVTVGPETTFQELVATMAEHRVSGVPVVDGGGRLVGIVSEADLLREGSHDRRRTRALDWFLHPGKAEEARGRGHDAAAIMTTPVVTVRSDRSLWEAIRTLRDAEVKRLPVVDADGRLVGIVSRVDLLSAFIRTDEQIAEQVRAVAAKVLATDLRAVEIEVHDGRVALSGSLDLRAQRDVLVDLIRHIPGVLDVEERFEVGPEGHPGVRFAPIQPPGAEAGPRADL